MTTNTPGDTRMATIYTGRTIQTRIIEVEQAGFNRCPLRSSGVFSWGQTPGHGETAHALLCAACGISVALKYQREFDCEIVAKFGPDWKMSGDDIRKWVRCMEDANETQPKAPPKYTTMFPPGGPSDPVKQLLER